MGKREKIFLNGLINDLSLRTLFERILSKFFNIFFIRYLELRKRIFNWKFNQK